MPTPENNEFSGPIAVDFQPVIDKWAASVSGNRSVLIYDLDFDELSASYNPDRKYGTASLYKLFVVYEGYRRITNGTWNADDKIVGETRLQCLDLAIRESYSPCAEALWSQIGHAELDAIIKNDFHITNSNISALSSNANDIVKILQLFYNHPDFNDETLVATMKDSFLNQPVTTYDWRRGLPSGFSNRVNVYNKVGWDWNSKNRNWNIYHDAAILEFPEQNRHFIVVVLTNQIDHKDIAKLGTAIEEAFFEAYQ